MDEVFEFIFYYMLYIIKMEWLLVGIAIVVILILLGGVIYYFTRPKVVPKPIPVVVQPVAPPVAPPVVKPVALPIKEAPKNIWNPDIDFTKNPADAFIASEIGGKKYYVAAIKQDSGHRIGTSDGTNIWYWISKMLPGESRATNTIYKVPLSEGVLLPKKTFPAASWSPTKNLGMAVKPGIGALVCRAKLADGLHPGITVASSCTITDSGEFQSLGIHDYLNVV